MIDSILAPTPLTPQRSSRLSAAYWTISDGLTIAWRYLVAMRRLPEALFFSMVQPVLFVLLFRYVFGGAVHVPNGEYVDYVIPGIFIQTVSFGAVSTSVGIAEDLHKGLIERFRALPMARSAVLTGRTTADLVRNVISIVIMTGIAFAVGFRVHTNVAGFLAGLLILILFAWTISWGFTSVGLAAPNSETANFMSFPILLPLTFASSAFVPVSTMPGWLQAFARNQPVSEVVGAMRALMVGGPAATYVVKALIWCLGLLAVLVPLALFQYRRAS